MSRVGLPTPCHISSAVAVVILDVDLASSTQTCLQYLYPLVSSGGVLFSQDGHIAPVRAVFDDDEFWQQTVGLTKPVIQGLGKQKLMQIEIAN